MFMELRFFVESKTEKRLKAALPLGRGNPVGRWGFDRNIIPVRLLTPICEYHAYRKHHYNDAGSDYSVYLVGLTNVAALNAMTQRGKCR